MTKEEREEAIAIIRKEYLCVDRDCDIERNCGKCDLMMSSKEPILKAYKTAIQALEQDPCEDAISRQAVLNAIMANCIWENEYNLTSSSIKKAVESLPPVKPQEPKTGHWVLTDDDFVYCSECEDSYYPRPIDASWLFCPHCGARME